jgi:hypothetical protein
VSAKRPLVGCLVAASGAWTSGAGATDFHVLEAHAGYELHLNGGVGDGHGTYGAGYVWDVFITHPVLRGAQVGLRADLLHCPGCEEPVDGGALLGLASVTFWKDDLSSVTWYGGLAPGIGYTRQTHAVFAEGELQTALQFRAIYSGLWVRPMLFFGAGGAYDGYASVGLRLAIGYSPNHGVDPCADRAAECEGPRPPRLSPSGCEPPERAELPAAEQSYVLTGCFRAGVSARVDGQAAPLADRGGDLAIEVGRTEPGAVQTVEIDIAGGSFSVRLERR